ncbi:hypothetical protein NKH19_09805 [Mesorhizobium sp. M1338]
MEFAYDQVIIVARGPMEDVDVVIIGAGPAGIATATGPAGGAHLAAK